MDSFDNMPFPVDYPFESNMEAVRWVGALQIAGSDRNKPAYLNAGWLLTLSQPLITRRHIQ